MEKNPIGRPRYNTLEALVHRGKVPADWKEVILEMGKKGKNKIHFSNYLGLGRKTFYKLLDRDPIFRRTIDLAIEYSEEWFISKAEEAWETNTGKNINTQFMKYYLQNVYRHTDWSDKQEVDITSGGDKLNQDNQIIVDIVLPKKTDEDNNN